MFENLINNPKDRIEAAKNEHQNMLNTFETKTYEGIPFGVIDGCIQGAYLAGHSFGTMYADKYGLFFIGTYNKSLGLEDFEWSSDVDEQGRAKSGPVFGSKQFVKCSSEEEFLRALKVVNSKLS